MDMAGTMGFGLPLHHAICSLGSTANQFSSPVYIPDVQFDHSHSIYRGANVDKLQDEPTDIGSGDEAKEEDKRVENLGDESIDNNEYVVGPCITLRQANVTTSLEALKEPHDNQIEDTPV